MAESATGPAGTSRQFWIEGPGKGVILERTLPARQARDVVVRALYSGISRGTEALVFTGGVPPSQYAAMRAPFQEGDLPGPVKYGYASVGRVTEAQHPEDAALEGRAVFALYPHQDVYAVPASAVTPLPEGLPAERAILAANMETAVNAVWDSGVSVGDRVLVVGGGVIGLLIAWLCGQVPGVELLVIDTNADKAPAARALDLQFQTRYAGDGGEDVVFNASGSATGLRAALAAAGMEATVVEVSWHGDAEVCLPLGEAFHSRRLTLRSSQVGRLPPSRAPRWGTRRRMALALDLLRDPRLDVLVTGESDFEELPTVLSRLSREPGAELCHRIRY